MFFYFRNKRKLADNELVKNVTKLIIAQSSTSKNVSLSDPDGSEQWYYELMMVA